MITEIFYNVDNFCQVFTKEWEKKLLKSSSQKLQGTRMLMSEIMTIVIYYHLSGFKCFKYYYNNHILKYYKEYIPNIVSYNRFVEIMQRTVIPLLYFLKHFRTVSSSEIQYIDSTKISVCNNKRISSNKVFKDKASRGKTSMGYFYGFKVHLIINHKGDLVSFAITKGNKADNNKNLVRELTKGLTGKLFGDKGYISKILRNELKSHNLELITKVRSNMKNKLMNIQDKILLKKRNIIETVNDMLKNICNIEHTRHRSSNNFFVNLISGLVAYTFLHKKPTIKFHNLTLSQTLI